MTPLEFVLCEITQLRLDSEELNLEIDAAVLFGIERLLIQKIMETDFEKDKFVRFGMTLLTMGLDPEALNDKLLNSVMTQSERAYENYFNAKRLFIKHKKNY
jgi:flagellar motor component MotA